jgi:nitroreductase
MVGTGPSEEELDQILTIASRVPDHGKLHPWRFVIVEADQREQFGALLRQALREEDPFAPPAKHEKANEFAAQAGALVVLISSPFPGHKIPVWEQELSAGAAAMNLLTAAHALGYVGGWLTGWYSYSPRVAEAFCRSGERIAGFIFIGTPGRELEERPRPPLDEVVSRWTPPGA